MFAFDPDIARQASQPFWCEAAPENKSHKRHDDANDDHEFSELAHRVKVARIARRHKVETRWQCSLEIITRRWVFQRRLAVTKFAARFVNWRENTILMSPRTKRPPKRNSRKSTKPTRC